MPPIRFSTELSTVEGKRTNCADLTESWRGRVTPVDRWTILPSPKDPSEDTSHRAEAVAGGAGHNVSVTGGDMVGSVLEKDT